MAQVSRDGVGGLDGGGRGDERAELLGDVFDGEKPDGDAGTGEGAAGDAMAVVGRTGIARLQRQTGRLCGRRRRKRKRAGPSVRRDG